VESRLPFTPLRSGLASPHPAGSSAADRDGSASGSPAIGGGAAGGRDLRGFGAADGRWNRALDKDCALKYSSGLWSVSHKFRALGGFPMEWRFHRNPGVEIGPLKSETVLFNPNNNKFCVLNTSAAFLWGRLERPSTVGELASELCTSFEVAEDQALRDAREVVQQLLEAEFVQVQPPTS